MSRKYTHYCDICEMDEDEEIKAVAEYIADDEETYQVCKKHLKHVKDAGLKFTMLK